MYNIIIEACVEGSRDIATSRERLLFAPVKKQYSSMSELLNLIVESYLYLSSVYLDIEVYLSQREERSLYSIGGRYVLDCASWPLHLVLSAGYMYSRDRDLLKWWKVSDDLNTFLVIVRALVCLSFDNCWIV